MKTKLVLIAALFSILLFTACSDDDDGNIIGDNDSTAPAAVDNLTALNPDGSSITLSWGSVGDDGYLGKARQYDIRYSTSMITEANFDQATPTDTTPYPKVSGYDESFVVTGLDGETKYYFALKVGDEVPNWSEISNIDSMTTHVSGSWIHYNSSNTNLLSNIINDIELLGNNRYFGTDFGLAVFDGDEWTIYTKDTTLDNYIIGDNITDLAIDNLGQLWIATANDGISMFNGADFINFTDSTSDLTVNAFQSIAVTSDNKVFAGSNSAGLFLFENDTWSNYNSDNSDLPTNFGIATLAVDATDNLWIGLNIGGLSKFDGINFENFNPSSGIWDIDFDSNGDVWFATDNGLINYNGSSFTTYDSNNSGIISNVVISVTTAPGGKVYAGTMIGLSRFDGSNWKSITTENSSIPDNQINTLETDITGNVYIGTPNGIAVYTE